MPEQEGSRNFRFGVYEASESRRELRKNGIRLKIHAQPFQVLLMLLARAPELVTRDEMRQQLWGTDTFVDFDHGLNTAVNKIRDVLNDSATSPRYVETVAGKGYRFIVPVTQLEVQRTLGEPKSSAVEAPGFLTAPTELPVASRQLVKTLLLAMQAMYVAFYVGALANLPEIHDIFVEAGLPASPFMFGLVTTAAVLIPVRLYLFTAVAMRFKQLPSKFTTIFPALLILDLVWALSPFLLIHHIEIGLALGLCAPLVYLPFAQRSLVLMLTRTAAD